MGAVQNMGGSRGRLRARSSGWTDAGSAPGGRQTDAWANTTIVCARKDEGKPQQQRQLCYGR